MDKKFVEILSKINPDIVDCKNDSLIDANIITSLTIMQIISELENQYNIDIDPDELVPENFESIDSIWLMLKRYLN